MKRIIKDTARILAVCILITSINFSFTGCAKKYDRDDIIQFVRKTTGLKEFEVSETYVPKKDEEGDGYRLWTVTDTKTDLVFYAIEHSYYAIFPVNDLLHNYGDAVLFREKDRLPEFKYLEINALKSDIDVETATITATYNNGYELSLCYREIQTLVYMLGYTGYTNPSISVSFVYNNPLRKAVKYVGNYGSSYFRTDTIPDYDQIYSKLITAVYYYRFEDTMKGFSDESVEAALKKYTWHVGVYRDESETPEFYDDIIYNDSGKNITFGSLYEILKREGFDPKGNAWRYSFYGIDGEKYEISYDFNDYTYTYGDDREETGFYYIKSGEKVPMNHYADYYFSEEKIEEMTGLRLTNGKPSEKDNQ